MAIFLNELARSFAEQRERRLTQIIYEAVQDGLAPFEPGRIAIYVDQELSERWIAIKIEGLPNLTFKTKPDWQLQDQTRILMSIAEKAFNFYRYREGLPVDDHIILGEN